jgi:hypothetical protein
LRIDFICFNFSITDGFEIFGVSKDEIDAVIAEKIVKPVPSGGRLDSCLMRTGQRVKVIENTFIAILNAFS